MLPSLFQAIGLELGMVSTMGIVVTATADFAIDRIHGHGFAPFISVCVSHLLVLRSRSGLMSLTALRSHAL